MGRFENISLKTYKNRAKKKENKNKIRLITKRVIKIKVSSLINLKKWLLMERTPLASIL